MGDLQKLGDVTDPRSYGGKAASLRWLMDHGQPVPPTWVIGASERVGANEIAMLDQSRKYAVRSSASVEDGVDFSFAGQFTTRLDVQGSDPIVRAVADVQRSVDSDIVTSYLEHSGHNPDQIEMAVIVQEMVNPVASGVVFSRNPISGLSEVVVEAVAGRGDRLVDDGVTPDRWVVRWGTFVEEPDDPVVPAGPVADLVERIGNVAEAYGSPVDVEWVWDGDQMWLVQLRPITGIDDIGIYSNRISREVMPGLIKPLVWSVNVPVVNAAWVDLITDAIGENDLEPADLARLFGYRAYFNMGAFGDIFEALGMPRDSLELLLGLPETERGPGFKPTRTTFAKTPRLLMAGLGKWRLKSRAHDEMAALRDEYAQYPTNDVEALDDQDIFARIDALKDTTTRAAALNIIVPLMANVANALRRRWLLRNGLDPEDVIVSSVTEMAAVNPQAALSQLAARAQRLDPADLAGIRSTGYDELSPDMKEAVDVFLDRFGHFSLNGNDMSVAPWRETPDTVVQMMLDAPTGATTSGTTWEAASSSLSPITRRIGQTLQRQTRALVGLREEVSSLYTFGYGHFRTYFLEVGRRLAARDRIDHADDVMYLTDDEIRRAFEETTIEDLRALVGLRRAEMEEAAFFDMPEVIIGEDFVPARRQLGSASELHGVATARGRYEGVVRIVTTSADFERVEQGEVIAIPFSDVGWTPLFAKAGAVIAEAGGMLSHSSIVAREYGIPCVVSVDGALHLPDGARVLVDGYEGTVQIVEGDN